MATQPPWLRELETEVFATPPTTTVFKQTFIDALVANATKAQADSSVPALQLSATEQNNYPGFVELVKNKAAPYGTLYTRMQAASNLTPQQVFDEGRVEAATPIVMQAIRGISVLNALIPYVGSTTADTADAARLAIANMVNDKQIVGTYSEEWMKTNRKDTMTSIDQIKRDNDAMRARVDKLEIIRHNLLAIGDNDAVMHRQRLVAKGLYIASLVVVVAFALGMVTAFITGAHGALYVTSAIVLAMVLLGNAVGLLTRIATWLT